MPRLGSPSLRPILLHRCMPSRVLSSHECPYGIVPRCRSGGPPRKIQGVYKQNPRPYAVRWRIRLCAPWYSRFIMLCSLVGRTTPNTWLSAILTGIAHLMKYDSIGHWSSLETGLMVRRSSVNCSAWGVDILLADGEGPQTHVMEGKNVPRKAAVREHATQEPADLQQSIQPPQAERSAVQQRLKATYYIWPEQDIALTTIQLYERKCSRRRCDKSELVREAIDMLVKKYNITL